MNYHEKEMKRLYENYFENVQNYANAIFRLTIKPWLEKYELTFVSGNGTFRIGYTENTPKWFVNKYQGYYDTSIDQDKIDSQIREILFTVIEGYNYDLGSIMPDYRKGE